jgi:predicted phage baseplate assembly protein
VPLESAIPIIDDRRYAEIMAEIRARIAHYTPEWNPAWSDVNHSDPGIIFAEVFAQLSEMLLYRMARVPQLSYIKFLQLIGEEMRPAQPATAEVSFVVADSWTEPSVLVPAGTQVSAASDGPPIVFETERPLRAVALQLRSVQAYDGAQYRDVTAANQGADKGFLPFGELPREGGALTLGLGFPPAHPNVNSFPSLIIDLAFWAATPDGQERQRGCGPLANRAYASARLQWEGWTGVHWRPIDTISDETLAFTQSGHMQVRVSANAGLVRSPLGAYGPTDHAGAAQPPLFWLRARLVETQYERPPRLQAVRTNTVPVIQAETVEYEILGGADGSRNQIFRLANTPIIHGSLQVEIDDGTQARKWEIRDDLLGSGRRDEHLAVNLSTGEVRAGDGENGAVPVANPANPDANVVATRYRYGGGSRGNVAARLIKTLLTPVAGIDGGKTENPFAAAGGREEERFEEASKRARQSLRARERAVTPEDFQLLAKAAGNVKRAKALPLVHPQFPGVKVPGAITVIVVPDAPDVGDTGSSRPTPSDGLLRTVCAYLDARRLLTTEVFVMAPRYLTVTVTALVVAGDDADPGAVKQAVEGALTDYFHPLRGGDEKDGWPFGAAIRYSKVVQRMFAAGGVDSVAELKLTVDGEEFPACSDVLIERIAPNALLALTDLAIEIVTRQEHEGMS